MRDKDTILLEEAYSQVKRNLVKENMIDMIDLQSVEIEGLERHEYPDFANAHIIYATYKNGTPLSYEELDQLNSEESTQLFIHDKIHGEQLYM